ncbi:SDR family oxidoreductase [Pseudoduganella lutea]|uniref:NmrA family transcriptional regulator n=1 Tax=Pseudoduganella lutea TaxID=321985 RepID=A0A4P6L5U5_9BURK|nr:NmrA family NAD(P)-binding protein [Pseudoduganella lutea]QBE67056.1 NmrA family transcriptional regulator [Pseudoduganella lutea]
MNIAVIGGTGLIGSKTVALLKAAGHAVRAAGPSTGVNTVTGEGLDDALAGAHVVIDVSNAPTFDPAEVRAFFETSGRNLLAAERRAGVRHHVVLSIVGADRMPGNGYFAAKVVQEGLVAGSGVPYTIVRSTQFLEFVKGIADGSTAGGTVRVAGGQFQPIAADDVAELLAGFAVQAPRNGVVEIAGPERAPFDDIVRRHLRVVGDPRTVERDDTALYFGGKVEELSLVPLATPHLGRITIDTWNR